MHEFAAKFMALLDKSSPSTIDQIQLEATTAKASIALEGRARPTTTATSSMLDSKTTPNLLPI
jgi:hypothetical protein